jgi:hypothetical protein
VAHTDRATVVRHLLEGQYSSPVRIVAFNPAEGWSRDVTDDIAAELAQACADRGETPVSIADFNRRPRQLIGGGLQVIGPSGAAQRLRLIAKTAR